MSIKEEAGLRLAEMFDHKLGNFPGLHEITAIPRDLLQMNQGADESGIVIEKRRNPGLPLVSMMIETDAFSLEPVAHKAHIPDSHLPVPFVATGGIGF